VDEDPPLIQSQKSFFGSLCFQWLFHQAHGTSTWIMMSLCMNYVLWQWLAEGSHLPCALCNMPLFGPKGPK
jgi:hypothetical protein